MKLGGFPAFLVPISLHLEKENLDNGAQKPRFGLFKQTKILHFKPLNPRHIMNPRPIINGIVAIHSGWLGYWAPFLSSCSARRQIYPCPGTIPMSDHDFVSFWLTNSHLLVKPQIVPRSLLTFVWLIPLLVAGIQCLIMVVHFLLVHPHVLVKGPILGHFSW